MRKRILTLLVIWPYLSGFDYFKNEINYWGKEENKSSGKKSISSEQKLNPEKKDKFDWDKHLNPENDEFFKEGNYLPPAAFMEVTRNPSDENIKNWFKLVGLKNELSTRLQKRMAEYSGPTVGGTQEDQVALLQAKRDIPQAAAPDHNKYRFRLYVDSKCPHCKRMLSTMEELQNKGFFVELKQVDDGPLTQLAPGLPIERASQGELNAKDIHSVPVLFVGDMDKKVVYRIAGYQSTSGIFQAIQNQKPFK